MKCKKMLGALLLTGAVIFSVNAGTVTRKSKDIKDSERLQSRKIVGVFEMTGCGKDANWGIAAEADFKYTVATEITSKIIKKEIKPNGRIYVIEERTFDELVDVLEINPPKAKIDLSTLPLEEFGNTARVTGAVASLITGNPQWAVIGEGAKAGVKLLKQTLDGKDIDSLPPAAKEKAREIIRDRFKTVLIKAKPRKVKGNTYRITYTQNRKGRPMKATFEKVGGGKLDKEEERILKRCNAFINYDMLPDVNKRVGGSWEVNARDMDETFDPFTDGYVTGSVKFVRKADSKDKNWNIAMQPAKLQIRNDDHMRIGELELLNGRATVEPKKFHNVIDMTTEGRMKTEQTSVHHLLFTARVSSWCKFQARFTSQVIK